MTKERLEQYESLKAEIGMLELQLASVGNTADTVSGSSPHFPYAEVSIAIVGYNEMLETKLRNRKKRLLKLREEIENFIDSIDDSTLRRIVTLYHIQGYSWVRISMIISGGEKSPDSYRKRLERFWEKN